MSPKVVIVILHLDDCDALTACLRSCAALTYPAHEIVVVENGSMTAHDLHKTQALCPRVAAIVRSGRNEGFTGGNNRGIAEALKRGADWVMLLNDDTEVEPDFLASLIEEGERDPRIGALCPAIFYFADPRRVWFAGAAFDRRTGASTDFTLDDRAGGAPRDSDWLTGCCLLMKRQALERVGMLDPRFFIYWEDTDWCLRIQAVGFRNVVVPAARIYHKVSLTMGGNDSPRKAYHKTRSHLAFARVHTPHLVRRLLWRCARDIAWLMLKSHDRARLPRARAYLAAVIDYTRGRTGRGPDWLWRAA